MELTAIILTKEDDAKLKRAIGSVSFVDEVLVVKEEFPIYDFSQVRNKALDQAKGEWVLFVDSDEEVSQELKEEIKTSINKNHNNYKNYKTNNTDKIADHRHWRLRKPSLRYMIPFSQINSHYPLLSGIFKFILLTVYKNLPPRKIKDINVKPYILVSPDRQFQ